MNADVVRSKQRLDNLFSKVSSLNYDPELQSHWARYLCVLVSGHLETSIKAIYIDYAKTKSGPAVANYVASSLQNLYNPNMNRLLNLASSFNPTWGEILKSQTEGQLADQVNTVVNNRNVIAHGGAQGLSFVRMKEYYESVLKVLEIIDKLCI